MSDDHMTIREMCDTFDVTPRTLRFYEAKELLFPVREGQKRWFTKRDRTRLKLILQAKRYGVSLEEIRQLLDIYDQDGTEAQLREAAVLGRKRLDELHAQRRQMDEAIADLEGLLNRIDQQIDGFRKATAAA